MKRRVARIERNIHRLSNGTYEVQVSVRGAVHRCYFRRGTRRQVMRAWVTETRQTMQRAAGTPSPATRDDHRAQRIAEEATSTVPPDLRALIVEKLAKALVTAWRRPFGGKLEG